MVEKVNACGKHRVIGTFSKNEWEDIRRKYYNICAQKYLPKAYKNKMQSLKEKYKEHKKLIVENTGLGWNSVLGTVDADNAWWDDYIKRYPKSKWIKKFRTEGCPEYDKLAIIFDDVVAVGKLHASHLDEFESSDDHVDLHPNVSHSTSRHSLPVAVSLAEEIPNDEVQEDATSGLPSRSTSRSSKRDTRERNEMDFNESIKVLAETSRARLEEKKRKREKKNKYSISECMKIIYKMALNIDNHARIRVLQLLQEKLWRETFVHMYDELRRDWILSV